MRCPQIWKCFSGRRKEEENTEPTISYIRAFNHYWVHLWQIRKYKRKELIIIKRKLKQNGMETWKPEVAQTYPLTRQKRKYSINDKHIRKNSSLLQLHLTVHKGPPPHQNSEHKTLPWLLVNLHTAKKCQHKKLSQHNNANCSKNLLVHFLAHTFI